MGGVLGKMRGHLVTRPMQRYNIESRAEKVLERDAAVPRPAPKFQSDRELLQEIRRMNPAVAEAAAKKDADLHSRLKEVFVRSTDPDTFDPDALKQIENPERPLPVRREHVMKPKNPYDASNREGNVPSGKMFLDDIQTMLSNYRSPGPDKLTRPQIVDKFGLSAEETVAATKHFAVLNKWSAKDATALQPPKDPLLPGPDWEEAPEKPLPGEKPQKPPPPQT